ncbi:MAG: hypothetical protein KC589_00960, partial [Nanoarchaeota archaeon]|nr:hypothetical protein [Nanoarchaeota archaeon]
LENYFNKNYGEDSFKTLLKIDVISFRDKLNYGPLYIIIFIALINTTIYLIENIHTFTDFLDIFDIYFFISLFIWFISILIIFSLKYNKVTFYGNYIGVGGLKCHRELKSYSRLPFQLFLIYKNIDYFETRNNTIILKLDPNMKKNYFNKIDDNNPFLVIYSIFSSSIKISNLSIEEFEKAKEILISKNVKSRN